MKTYLLNVGIGMVALGSSCLAEAVDFTLKFEPGKSYISQTELVQGMTMSMAGQEIETSTKMSMKSAQTVTETEKGLEIEQKNLSMLMDMDAGGMAMKYDSANPEGPMAAMFDPMMNAKTTLILDKEGKFVEVIAPEVPGAENIGMGKAELEAGARTMLDLMANEKVSEGESWQTTTTLPLGGLTGEPVSLSYTMTFEKMEERDGHKVAKVGIVGKVAGGDENVKVTSKKVEGTMYFDPSIGQPRELKISMDLEIGLPEGVPVEAGASGTMPVTSHTTSKLIEIK